MFLLIHVFLSTQHEALPMVIAETFDTTALSHFNMLYTFLYTIFTTVHIQWIRNISIDKRAVYAHPDYACVFIFSVYHLAHSSFDSSSHFSVLRFQLFFFLRRYLYFDLIIITAEHILLASC